MEIQCSKCKKQIKIKKTLGQGSNFAFIYLDGNNKKMYGKICPKCRRDRENKRNKETNFTYFKIYEKTPNGFLMRMYHNMKSRINGIQKKKHHLYKEKYLLPKEDFYKWAKSNNKFFELFSNYEASGYDQKLAPSVDRIDSAKGYEITNMEWVTHSENSRRGSNSMHRKK